jgi:hypothetical protein
MIDGRPSEPAPMTSPDRPSSLRGRLAAIDWAPIALAVPALVLLVSLGRDMTFYHDEWALILKRDLSVDGILHPTTSISRRRS